MLKIKKQKIRRSSAKPRIVIGCIVGVLFVAGGFLTYHQLFPSPQITVANSPSKPVERSAAEAKKPTEKTPDRSTPATHPDKLIIKSLGIDANVVPMGILDNGALEAPKTAWNVGWYDQSALPGSGKNALLIDGHVNDSLNTPGVFFKINTFKPGDTMKIQRGDKQTFVYKVVKVEQKPIEQVDMAAMLRSATPGTEGLNLITCGGAYDYHRETYNDRILVYAVRTQ